MVGHQFDLEDLARWLAGQDVHVASRDGKFVLIISSAITGGNYEPVRGFAEEQLELISGVGRLLNSTFRPVSLAGQLFGVDSAGAVVAVDTAELRTKAGPVRPVLGGEVQPDQREAAATSLLRAAALFLGRATLSLSLVGQT